MSVEKVLEFQIIGPFALTDFAGVDRRPRLQKSRAILAILAATPGHRHSRSWFQSMLWSDRQHEQGLSSLRTALADIRRHLGPFSEALIASHSEVALNPAMIRVASAEVSGARAGMGFLEGFDVAHAEGFEDWLRERRMAHEHDQASAEDRPSGALAIPRSDSAVPRIFLATGRSASETVTGIQTDVLVDSLAKSAEDLVLSETVDGRGREAPFEVLLNEARAAGCQQILVAESAESAAGAVARLKLLETETRQLVWSQSLTGSASLDLDAPATLGVAAEFIDVISEKRIRGLQFGHENLSPSQLSIAGANHIFKLGAQNYETADALLKRAHELDQRGTHLAWRAYLRTFFLCEREFGEPDVIVEEGTALARRALEKEPQNSMVLALCAHVETMLHRSYASALDLSERALVLNRCNPLAWATLGVAQAYLGDPGTGFRNSQIGSRLAAGSRYSFQTEAWSMVTGVLAGEFDAARTHAELSHAKATGFAPPLRFLTALYCMAGDFEKAELFAARLRAREPEFTLDLLGQDGYPAAALRKAKVLEVLPAREI